MEKELIDEIRTRLHATIDAVMDEYSVKLSKSTEQQIQTPDELDIDKLPWQKSKHGQYEYLFPSQVPDKLQTALKDGKAQIKDCILYLTKQGSVRRYRITNNKQTANSSTAPAGDGGDVKR